MDIFIKSFNRAYYLERCIKSIYQFITGDFQIHVLDDGTPPIYLDKIVKLYPDIKIHYSPLYQQKVKALADHISKLKEYDQFVIPTDFWIKYISHSSKIFLLLEDDIWLTAPVALPRVQELMLENKMVMLRLSWQGNQTLITGKKVKVDANFEELIPSLSSLSEAILINRYKIASILYRLKLMNEGKEFQLQLPFYTLYTVASAFFDKDYWLYLWKDAQMKVNESHQLKRAIQWRRNTQSRIAKSVTEKTKTSYLSSATNNYKDVQLDLLRFNYHLNEAWQSGEFNVMQNFPNDFEPDYIKPFLDNVKDNESTYEEWLKWVAKFKEQYKRLGCEVD